MRSTFQQVNENSLQSVNNFIDYRFYRGARHNVQLQSRFLCLLTEKL